jgi:hypothetical protein
MGRTAYSSANWAYPFLQEESEPSEEELQGRRDSNPRPTVLETQAPAMRVWACSVPLAAPVGNARLQ